MLKNCCLPINYNKTISQTCGEIVCKNLDEFIITCKLCLMKIFEFEEFVQHFKSIHLNVYQFEEYTVNGQDSNKIQSTGNEFEITEISEQIKTERYKCENVHGQDDSDESESYRGNRDEELISESSAEQQAEVNVDDEEEQTKSIIRKTRKPKELSCEICNKKYTDARRLHLHVKIVHLREKPYKCSKCDQAFAAERSLNTHIESQHIGYECPECHKIFRKNRNLKLHMLLHLDKKEFICTADDCGKAFVTKGRLKEHQRYHTDSMFICEECGYKCRKRDSLIVHKRRHTGDKPFACELCEARFGSKALLNEHMAAHELERKHVCDVCGKSFNRPKALYHHKHLHLGIKKFVCKICGQAYAQAAGLSAHTRKHREGANSFLTGASPFTQ